MNAQDKLNNEYMELVNKLIYARMFTPHKVAYYESLITEIVCRGNKK